MSSPFRIEGPAIVSFSGGRTSAYMLWRILEAHGGSLPEDVRAVFANTGRERPETLDFVREVEERWRVPVVWLEWRDGLGGPFAVVDHATASRAGEPFAALIDKKRMLPKRMLRFCTQHLKVEPIEGYARSLGFAGHLSVIGLRADEGLRILKGYDNAARDGRRVLYPLAEAGIRERHVQSFWRAQDFDLAIDGFEGNCDLCFMKGPRARRAVLRYRPELAGWWIAQEEKIGQSFDLRHPVSLLLEQAGRSWGATPAVEDEPDFDAECGLHCGYAEGEE